MQLALSRVTYTHPDVYKRQAFHTAKGIRIRR